MQESGFAKNVLFESKFPALTINVLVRTVPPVVSFSDWRHFFLPGTSQWRLEFSSVRKGLINAHARQGFNPVGIPAKLSRVCQLGPCLYVTVHIPCQGLYPTVVRPLIAKSEYT